MYGRDIREERSQYGKSYMHNHDDRSRRDYPSSYLRDSVPRNEYRDDTYPNSNGSNRDMRDRAPRNFQGNAPIDVKRMEAMERPCSLSRRCVSEQPFPAYNHTSDFPTARGRSNRSPPRDRSFQSRSISPDQHRGRDYRDLNPVPHYDNDFRNARQDHHYERDSRMSNTRLGREFSSSYKFQTFRDPYEKADHKGDLKTMYHRGTRETTHESDKRFDRPSTDRIPQDERWEDPRRREVEREVEGRFIESRDREKGNVNHVMNRQDLQQMYDHEKLNLSGRERYDEDRRSALEPYGERSSDRENLRDYKYSRQHERDGDRFDGKNINSIPPSERERTWNERVLNDEKNYFTYDTIERERYESSACYSKGRTNSRTDSHSHEEERSKLRHDNIRPPSRRGDDLRGDDDRGIPSFHQVLDKYEEEERRYQPFHASDKYIIEGEMDPVPSMLTLNHRRDDYKRSVYSRGKPSPSYKEVESVQDDINHKTALRNSTGGSAFEVKQGDETSKMDSKRDISSSQEGSSSEGRSCEDEKSRIRNQRAKNFSLREVEGRNIIINVHAAPIMPIQTNSSQIPKVTIEHTKPNEPTTSVLEQHHVSTQNVLQSTQSQSVEKFPTSVSNITESFSSMQLPQKLEPLSNIQQERLSSQVCTGSGTNTGSGPIQNIERKVQIKAVTRDHLLQLLDPAESEDSTTQVSIESDLTGLTGIPLLTSQDDLLGENIEDYQPIRGRTPMTLISDPGYGRNPNSKMNIVQNFEQKKFEVNKSPRNRAPSPVFNWNIIDENN